MDIVIEVLSAIMPSNLPILITALLAIAVGGILCASTHGAKVGLLFLQATVFLFIYLAGRYLTLEANNPSTAFSWAQVTSIGVLCAPIALYHYVAQLVDVASERRVFIAFNWIFALCLVVLNLMTGFLYSGVLEYSFGYVPQYSEWGSINSAWTVMVMAVVILDFVLQYRSASVGSLRRRRFRACFMAQLWVFPLYIDSISSHGIALPQIGWFAVFMFIAQMASAVSRYRFVDITPAFAAQKVMDTVGEAILVLDAEGEVRVANKAVGELLQRSPDALVGRQAEQLLPQLGRMALDRTLAESGGEAAEQEFELQQNNGLRVMAMHVTRLGGADIEGGYVCSLRDVSRQKQVEQQLRYESLHDALTGLPNRVAFQAQLEFQLKEQGNKNLAVLFIDLNGFKKINDSYGHRAGDEVLATVARRMLRACPNDAVVSRLAGDEFAVLLLESGHSTQTAQAIANELLKPMNIEQGQITVGASIGISHARGDTGDSALALLKNADHAMYQAKGNGGGFEVFDESKQGAIGPQVAG